MLSQSRPKSFYFTDATKCKLLILYCH